MPTWLQEILIDTFVFTVVYFLVIRQTPRPPATSWRARVPRWMVVPACVVLSALFDWVTKKVWPGW